MPEVSSIWWGLLLLGLFAGVLSGMLGLGSGTILIPAMTILFLFRQESAQGTALAVMVPIAGFAAFLYWRDPAIEISLRAILLIAAGGLVGAWVGKWFQEQIPEAMLKKVFAVFLILVALKILIFPGASKQRKTKEPASRQSAALIQKENVDELASG